MKSTFSSWNSLLVIYFIDTLKKNKTQTITVALTSSHGWLPCSPCFRTGHSFPQLLGVTVDCLQLSNSSQKLPLDEELSYAFLGAAWTWCLTGGDTKVLPLGFTWDNAAGSSQLKSVPVGSAEAFVVTGCNPASLPAQSRCFTLPQMGFLKCSPINFLHPSLFLVDLICNPRQYILDAEGWKMKVHLGERFIQTFVNSFDKGDLFLICLNSFPDAYLLIFSNLDWSLIHTWGFLMGDIIFA